MFFKRLPRSIERFRAAYRDQSIQAGELRRAGVDVSAAAKGGAPAALEEAARSLAPLLAEGEPARRQELAMLIGVLVERGCAPGAVAASLIASCKEILTLAAPWYAELGRRAEAMLPEDWEPTEDEEALTLGDLTVPRSLAAAVTDELPREAAAFEAVERSCLPAIACLTRDATLRRVARADEALRTAAERLAAEGAFFLYRLLRAPSDEPWIVLHPDTQRGWRVRVRETPDNFTLHSLLAGVLPADVVAVRPSAELLAYLRGDGGAPRDDTVRGAFNLYTWRAIGADRRLLPDVPHEHWVWNEGLPCGVPVLDGVPVLVVGRAAYERSWNSGRVFSELDADVVLEGPLTEAEVAAWLARAATAGGSSV